MWSIQRMALIGITIALTVNTAVAQRVRWDENEDVRQAVLEAQKRLSHRRCAQIFGQNPDQILLSATFSFLSLGKPQRLSNGKIQVVNAATIRENNTIILNVDGAFWNTQMRFGGVRFDAEMSGVQMRALMILHELGHLTGVFHHDGGDAFSSRMYTARVRENCF